MYELSEELSDSIPTYIDKDAVAAYCEWTGEDPAEWGDISDAFKDSYEGRYDHDRDFAMQMADNLGYEQPDHWPYNCIDWTYAAKELMYDYVEEDGYYFRNC